MGDVCKLHRFVGGGLAKEGGPTLPSLARLGPGSLPQSLRKRTDTQTHAQKIWDRVGSALWWSSAFYKSNLETWNGYFIYLKFKSKGLLHCIQLNKKIGLGHLGQEGSGGKQSRAVVIWEEEAVVASLAHTANSCTWQKRALPFSSEPQRLSPPHRSEASGSLMWLCPRQRYTRTQNVILSLHVRLGLPPLPFRGT